MEVIVARRAKTSFSTLGLMMKKIFTVLMLILTSGCAGTLHSRFDRVQSTSSSCFGKWPYQAVVTDFVVVKNKHPLAIVAAVSFPIDIIIDTICLPLDLVLWPFGFEKNPDLKMKF
jgi:uncharacterized protein YceK